MWLQQWTKWRGGGMKRYLEKPIKLGESSQISRGRVKAGRASTKAEIHGGEEGLSSAGRV